MKVVLNKAKVWETVAVMLFGFSVLYWFTQWNGFVFMNLTLGIISLISFPLTKRIVKAWYKTAEFLGGITSKVLLSLVFFLFLIPVALMYRISRKRKKAYSNWQDRNHRFSVSEFEKVW